MKRSFVPKKKLFKVKKNTKFITKNRRYPKRYIDEEWVYAE